MACTTIEQGKKTGTQKKSQFINKLHPILIEEGSENMTKIIKEMTLANQNGRRENLQ
jgi:hypothetical protein